MVKRRYPIRVKLTIATLLPLLVAIVICWLMGVSILTAKATIQSQERVQNDLLSAREIYRSENEHLRDLVKYTTVSPYLAEALGSGASADELAGILEPMRRNEPLDMFTLVDATGIVRCRSHNPKVSGDDRSRDPLVKRALAGEILMGTTIVPARQLLALEGEELARRASIRGASLPVDATADAMVKDAALLLVAAAPVRDRAGNIVGALYGGMLLNNNIAFADKVSKALFEGNGREGKEPGRVTVTLGDLRIATNGGGAEAQRMVGSRIMPGVFDRVVLKDERWTGRTFLQHDWYLTAYEPIRSLQGVPVGALAVGMLEKPYTWLKINVTIWFSAILLVGGVIGVVAARLLSVRVSQPVKQLETLARRVAAGERGVHIAVASDDEIGDLAAEFNRMSEALSRQDQEIMELNRGLERKVQERTLELEEKNRLLLEAQQELVRVEKLAAIGELAAGVAHEINNPLAIIRGNSELLQSALPGESPCQEEVAIITGQVGRMERIVNNLLRFARKERKQVGEAPVNRLLDEILGQVGHQVSLDRVTIVREYDPVDPVVAADGDQLRQVFTNLILNALQAMPEGGTLTVATRGRGSAGCCEVVVADTGCGIAPEDVKQVFNPFFTTRSGGTGLGLSVSYGIIKDHGGDIIVESSPGSGSTFMVVLPGLLSIRSRDEAAE